MSKKIKVLIQAPHVIHNDAGTPMVPSFTYHVEDSLLIQQYLSEGLVSAVEDAPAPLLTETDKKPSTKNSKDQATDPINS